MGSRINPGSETAGRSLIISSLFEIVTLLSLSLKNLVSTWLLSKATCCCGTQGCWLMQSFTIYPIDQASESSPKGGNSQQTNFGNHPRSTLSSPRRQFCCRKDKAGCYALIKLIPQLFFTNRCIWSLKITTVNENSWFIRGVGFWIFHASSFVFLLFSVILATILFSR